LVSFADELVDAPADRAVRMEVTIYNPALDEDGNAGRELTNVLVAALGTSSPGSTTESARTTPQPRAP
jgi:arginase family enzyme